MNTEPDVIVRPADASDAGQPADQPLTQPTSPDLASVEPAASVQVPTPSAEQGSATETAPTADTQGTTSQAEDLAADATALSPINDR